jgi:hypothetical protein
MQKPEVRIIDHQKESIKDDISVSNAERDFLLAKYGYKTNSFDEKSSVHSNDPYGNMTVQEFNELYDSRIRERQMEDQRRRNTPKAYTFDNVNYYESKYTDLDLDGQNLGIQVQVMSDMPINNNKRL